MLKSRYARANLFKCDFQLGIVEIFWALEYLEECRRDV